VCRNLSAGFQVNRSGAKNIKQKLSDKAIKTGFCRWFRRKSEKMETRGLFNSLFEKMLRAERQAAVEMVESLLREGVKPEFVVQKLLDPALVKQGQMWGSGQLSLAQAYVSARIAEEILLRCVEARHDNEPIKKRGVIVIGNIEDDFHSLGRKIVAIFLKSNGWIVYDLGNDVMAEDFVEEAVARNAAIIAASAMMYTTALNIKKIRKILDERSLSGRIKLAVGGAVFNGRPDLVSEVGGDGSAANAFESLDLMDRLLHSQTGGIQQ